MVRQFIVTLAALVALVCPALAGGPDCDDCNTFKRGVHRTVIPTNNLVCFWFIQERPGKVMLKLTQKDGTVRPYTKAHAKVLDKICVGRHWVRNATADSFLCNDSNTFRYGLPGMIEAMAEKETYAKDHEACLLGTKVCEEKGYPVHRREQ